MKPGTRVLGIAESFGADESSTLGGVVMTCSGRVDDFVFGRCTVGGTDISESIIEMVERLDREDIRFLLIAGVALAWYNIIDLEAIHAETALPTIAVTFEASDGLETAIEENIDDRSTMEDRHERYARLPPRRAVTVNKTTLYLREAGCRPSEADEVIIQCTESVDARPAPLRVARLAARAVDAYRTTNANA